MSFVIAAPETLVRAASDLANIGSTLGAANAAALGPTTELLAAGADEVSAAIASLFAAHGQAYQAVSAQMSAFHAQFVQTFTAGAGAYASAEAAAAAPLEGLLNIVNTPTQLLLGRPLIGNGANGAPGTGQAGGAGGLLYGNGGAGGSGAPGQGWWHRDVSRRPGRWCLGGRWHRDVSRRPGRWCLGGRWRRW